ncbi:MAG: ABC transporter permease [Candidatus Aminicenantes bacterium]|nr:MAG: ABC transporter permease [Candidatus Aminicenantes bacterium]
MTGNIFKFAWKNIWRNKRRTYFTIFALAVGVMSVTFFKSYLAGIITSASEENIKNQFGHIKVVHKEFLRLERIMPRERLVTADDITAVSTAISRTPGVELMCERIIFTVLLNHRDINEPAVAVGIDPGKAEKSMQLSQTLSEGNYYDASGLNLIIGKSLAQKLNVTLNDELLLVTTDINYSTYALPFKIAGIFETGYSSIDKHILYIPLEKAREMLDCGTAAHEILVFLKDPQQAIQVSEQIKSVLPGKNPLQVIPWQKQDIIKRFIPVLEEFFDKIMNIFMIIVGIVILNTMLMAVMERYHEIGVLKALGLSDREVTLMIMIEAFFLGVIGSVMGGLLGGPMAAITEKTGIDLSGFMGKEVWGKLDIPLPLFEKILYPDFTVSILIGSIVFGILVALVAVLYPAFKSSKMLPVEAFHWKLKI